MCQLVSLSHPRDPILKYFKEHAMVHSNRLCVGTNKNNVKNCEAVLDLVLKLRKQTVLKQF